MQRIGWPPCKAARKTHERQRIRPSRQGQNRRPVGDHDGAGRWLGPWTRRFGSCLGFGRARSSAIASRRICRQSVGLAALGAVVWAVSTAGLAGIAWGGRLPPWLPRVSIHLAQRHRAYFAGRAFSGTTGAFDQPGQDLEGWAGGMVASLVGQGLHALVPVSRLGWPWPVVGTGPCR